MNKKEVAEIRKQFSPENCVLTRICGCYVDAEKNKKTELDKMFVSLPEEETFKYFDIFKKTLSGPIGKNIINLSFPLEGELNGDQKILTDLRSSKLNDATIVEAFYDTVIESYGYNENYYIILTHGVYDIPGATNDGLQMEDASDYVYNFILCSICPVNLSKAGLSYHAEKNSITGRTRDWLVEAPSKGFLFPLFNDRAPDIHGALYYSKNTEDLQPEFINHLFHCESPLSKGTQEKLFCDLIEDTLGETADTDTVFQIYENLAVLKEEKNGMAEEPQLSMIEVKEIIKQSGAANENVNDFEKIYEETIGKGNALYISNIASPKELRIETPDVSVKVKPESMHLVETKIIDGAAYIVIKVNEHVEINHITARSVSAK